MLLVIMVNLVSNRAFILIAYMLSTNPVCLIHTYTLPSLRIFLENVAPNFSDPRRTPNPINFYQAIEIVMIIHHDANSKPSLTNLVIP